KLEEVDRYMLHQLQNLIASVKESYEAYDFQEVSQKVHNYVAVDLSAFYLDFAKDILYIEAADNDRRRSIQTVYYETLVALVKLLNQIISHPAEEVCEYIHQVDAKYVELTYMQ